MRHEQSGKPQQEHVTPESFVNAGQSVCIHQILLHCIYLLHPLRSFISLSAYAEAFLEGFASITANEVMVEGLRGQGHAWCIHDNCPGALHQDLAYLTTNRVMPSTSIKQLQQCFEVTEVRLLSCWPPVATVVIPLDDSASDMAGQSTLCPSCIPCLHALLHCP